MDEEVGVEVKDVEKEGTPQTRIQWAASKRLRTRTGPPACLHYTGTPSLTELPVALYSPAPGTTAVEAVKYAYNSYKTTRSVKLQHANSCGLHSFTPRC